MNIVTHAFADFDEPSECDAILNFVGLGAPSRIARESLGLATLDHSVGEACMSLLRLNPRATYLYLSSGASYGSDFAEPAMDTSELPDQSHFELPKDTYGWVKRSAEVRHRSMPHYKIINLRIFGYASRNMDLEAGFLLSDLGRSLINRKPVRITRDKTIRDFINPEYFYQVVEFCLANEIPNTSIDLVSSNPLSKSELIEALVREYGIQVEWTETSSPSHSRPKQNYFSLSNRLRDYGFHPQESALEMVLEEFRGLVFTNQG